jgi:hypothetical protein
MDNKNWSCLNEDWQENLRLEAVYATESVKDEEERETLKAMKMAFTFCCEEYRVYVTESSLKEIEGISEWRNDLQELLEGKYLSRVREVFEKFGEYFYQTSSNAES